MGRPLSKKRFEYNIRCSVSRSFLSLSLALQCPHLHDDAHIRRFLYIPVCASWVQCPLAVAFFPMFTVPYCERYVINLASFRTTNDWLIVIIGISYASGVVKAIQFRGGKKRMSDVTSVAPD